MNNNSTPSYRHKIGDQLRFRDTISELYDQGDKDAVYNSSMKKGGAVYEFNETLKRDPKGLEHQLLNFLPHPQPQMANSFTGRVPQDFDQD